MQGFGHTCTFECFLHLPLLTIEAHAADIYKSGFLVSVRASATSATSTKIPWQSNVQQVYVLIATVHEVCNLSGMLHSFSLYFWCDHEVSPII